MPTFVVYGIPDRDCTGGFSGGGLPADGVRPVGAGDRRRRRRGSERAVVVVEPDALASALECDRREERVRLIADAVDRLRGGGRHDVRRRRPLALGRRRVRWRRLLEQVGVDDVRGFATNVSNYQTDDGRAGLRRARSASCSAARTSSSTAAATATARPTSGATRPAAPSASSPARRPRATSAHLDAYVWVKPAGESDGECNGGPAAGRVLAGAGAGDGGLVRLVRSRRARRAPSGGTGANRVVSLRPMQPGNDWVAVIIEDDPDVRDLIDIVLTQSGFRTVVTENGPEGVEAVRQHNPLITTLDVNMPGMDGFAVAKPAARVQQHLPDHDHRARRRDRRRAGLRGRRRRLPGQAVPAARAPRPRRLDAAPPAHPVRCAGRVGRRRGRRRRSPPPRRGRSRGPPRPPGT